MSLDVATGQEKNLNDMSGAGRVLSPWKPAEKTEVCFTNGWIRGQRFLWQSDVFEFELKEAERGSSVCFLINKPVGSPAEQQLYHCPALTANISPTRESVSQHFKSPTRHLSCLWNICLYLMSVSWQSWIWGITPWRRFQLFCATWSPWRNFICSATR